MTTTYLPTSFSDRPAFDPLDLVPLDEVEAILEREQREADEFARRRRGGKYSPDQPRDDHGRFGEGSGAINDIIAPPRPQDQRSGADLGSPLAQAIAARTGEGGYGPEQHALIVAAIQNAPHDAPVLYRGFPMNESNGWSAEERQAFTSQLQVGSTIEMRLGSFTESKDAVGQFAGVDSYLRPTGGVGTTMPPVEGGHESIMADIARSEGFFISPTGTVIQPTDERVVIAVQPGAQALNMQPYASPDFADQAEWDTLGAFHVESVAHDGTVWKVQVSQVNSDEPTDVRGGERQNGLPDA